VNAGPWGASVSKLNVRIYSETIRWYSA